jgi:hypothetical protein
LALLQFISTITITIETMKRNVSSPIAAACEYLIVIVVGNENIFTARFKLNGNWNLLFHKMSSFVHCWSLGLALGIGLQCPFFSPSSA